MKTSILQASDSFSFGPQTRALIECVVANTTGVITDDELAEVAGGCCAPKGKYYHNLQTALRHVRDERRQHWSRVRRMGCIARRGAAESLEDMSGTRRRVSRQASKSLAIAATIDTTVLEHDARNRLAAEAAIACCVERATSPAQAKRLISAAAYGKSQRELTLPLLEGL